MSFNKKHFENRKAAKVEEAVEFDGFMPWSPENGLMPWGTPAQCEAAEQALVRHFTY